MNDYKKINKIAWDIKTDIHINSEFYNNKSFLKGESSLKHIELDLLGEIKGKSMLHLQCHFGQDTISLARLGAKVTGIDLSDKAIDYAKMMSKELNVDAKFICSDIYELPNVLDEKFDIVFTSYGVIGWLPDMEQWAKVISHYLKPKGHFIMVEFHPVVWMFDDDFRTVDYSYFKAGEIIEQLQGTYADQDSDVKYSTVTWNHSLSDVLNNLIRANIQINRFEEYDYSPYNCFKHTVETDREKYRIKHLDDKLPMIYAIEGVKN